ncbi:hypothetical protein ACJX0J_007851, partial [Zea mays]
MNFPHSSFSMPNTIMLAHQQPMQSTDRITSHSMFFLLENTGELLPYQFFFKWVAS